MHILILPSWYPPQGGGFFKVQAEKISSYGNNVGVIYLEEYSVKDIFKKIKIGRLFKIRVVKENSLSVVRMAWIRLPLFERLNIHLRVPLYRKLYKEYVNIYGTPEIIHCHSCLWAGYFAYTLKKEYSIPYIITEHRGRFNIKNRLTDPEIRGWFKSYINKALNNSGKTICVSKYLITGLKRFAPDLSDNNFIVIPNIFEPDFQNEMITTEKAFKPLKLLCVAVFSAVKNHGLLIGALEELNKQGHEIRLMFAGDGPNKKKCEKLVQYKGLTDHVEFYGHCDKSQIINLLNECNYLVLSSLTEAQPVVILESFSMGVPVIVPDVISDDIVNKTNGYIYETGNVKSLVNILLEAISNPLQYDSHKLRLYAAENFGEKITIKEIENVYNEVLNKTSKIGSN